MSGDEHGHTSEAMAELARDEFLIAALPELIGDCERPGDHGSWCHIHDARWQQNASHCMEYGEVDDFADRVIEAWEGRAR